MDYSIGEIARWVGYAVQTVRYYEQMGLLPKPWRTGRGQRRRYDDDSLKRLHFIRHARELGFSLDEIRSLLDLSDTPPPSGASVDTATAAAHVAAIDAKIDSLNALREELNRLIQNSAEQTESDSRILDLFGTDLKPATPDGMDPAR